MKRNVPRLVKFGAGLVALTTLSSVLTGYAARSARQETSVPTDWSHRHLIFSAPGSEEQAKLLAQDPRYWQQLQRRSQRLQLPVTSAAMKTDSAEMASGLRPEWHAAGVAVTKTANGDWSENLGSGAATGAGVYPAKFSFKITTANCASAAKPDYVVYGTGLLGSPTQASVVGYDNLYSGCTGTVPSTYWAYNTAGQILTSPVLSEDGTQVAFVQTNLAGLGTLVLLKWAASSTETVSLPAIPVIATAALYPSCIAPCMTTVILRDSSNVANNNTNSSIFYDYGHDTAWVGDNLGWLHKFNPVFKGTLTEIRTGGFPVQVNSTSPTILTSPVYDSASTNVFVADAAGFLYRVNSTTAAVTTSAQLDFGTGFIASPIVDSTAGLVYVFASSDGTTKCTGGVACSAVYQLTTTFTNASKGTKQAVGSSTLLTSTPNPIYDGAFDSQYESSVNATGHLEVCGNTGGVPTVYRLPITAGVLGTAVAGPALSSSTTPCSPVSDILNSGATGGATEWIFASAQASGTSSGCNAGGCIFNFKNTPWLASTSYAIGQQIVDIHFQIEVVDQAGTSGTTTPAWTKTVGATTPDGPVRWLNQGPVSAATLAAWAKTTVYAKGAEILDSNHNVELVKTPGTSATSTPAWSTSAGGAIVDGTVHWTNVGALATSALPAAGGTSGIIIDNTVGSSTLPGASQIYFSTLGNQTCGTSGTGGCAVQASQAALQ